MKEGISTRSGGRRGFDAGLESTLRSQARQQAEAFEREDPTVVQFGKELVNSVDMNGLRDIFSEIARRSGVDDQDMNFIEPENIFVVGSGALIPQGVLLGQVPQANCILINGDTLKNYSRRMGQVNPENTKAIGMLVVSSIIHEYVHATGAQRREFRGGSEMIRSGLFEAKTGVRTAADIDYNLLNEGVTLLLEEEVANEYARRHPFSRTPQDVWHVSDLDTARASYVDAKEYKAARVFVGRLIDHIATQTGIERNAVKNAFVKAYFDGSGMSAENREALDELLGADFSERARTANSPRALEKIVGEFTFPDLPTSSISEIFRRLFYGNGS